MLPDKAKFMEFSIINPALLLLMTLPLLMKHLVVGQLNEYQFFSDAPLRHHSM